MRKIAGLISLVYVATVAFVAVPSAGAHILPTVRLNAGGSAYTDSQGHEWEADNYYNTGQAGATTSDDIAGTDDDTLYQSEHWTWEEHQGPLQYTFDVPDGAYQVRLHFAEIYEPTSQTGARVFDASVQDNIVMDDFDIYNEAGADSAVVQNFTVQAVDGQVAVKFHDAAANSPKVSAIELIGQAHAHSLPTFRVNTGGDAYTDSQGREWEADNYYTNGFTNSTTHSITGTEDDTLYQSERWNWTELGTTMSYGFEVPEGNYHVRLHFAEIYPMVAHEGGRIFDVAINDQIVLKDFDVYSESGAAFTALTKSFAANVTDGQLDIDFLNGSANNPKISAIEVIGQNQHWAHAVAGDDQTVVDIDQTGSQEVTLDGSFSHTHAIDHQLTGYRWSQDGVTLATDAVSTVSLPQGVHEITLTIIDSADTVSADTATITVLDSSQADLVPQVSSLSPDSGPESGGNQLTITGQNFYYPAADTVVTIGQEQLTGQDIAIDGTDQISLTVPAGTGAADVTVTTPGGTSQPLIYTYDDTAPPPVQFTQGTLISDIPRPTAMAFGPDGKLYVTTVDGDIWVLTLDEDYTVTDVQTSNIIEQGEAHPRTPLGLAFNPFDDPEEPRLYVSHSSPEQSGTDLYNGKVSVVSGPDLSVKKDLVTGLPVGASHTINGLEFDPDGKLYIQVGSSTNAGIPHPSFGDLDETPLSAATLVAPIQDSEFDGAITWDGQGNQTGGDVSVFAAGLRNPYDLLWHTNGHLYSTDNGPNADLGAASTSCTTEGDHPDQPDKLVLLEAGNYYGHPNRARGATDPRQCIYYPPDTPSGNGYTAPLTTFTSSTNGISEYYVNTFDGQMRGDLLGGRFAGSLFRVKLSADGRSVVSNETFQDIGDLDVAIGPDGTILVMRHWWDEIITYTPDEPAPTDMRILSATPRRGPLTGNRPVTVTGNNFGTNPTVEIGGNPCPVTSATSTKIICTVPHGAAPGPTAVTVSNSTENATLENGYIYLNR